MPDKALYALPEQVGEAFKSRGLMLATAESCTGGWVAEAVTMVPGSSDWFERDFVTYTYISKREVLGVKEATLENHGAVSEQVVREAAQGALTRSHAPVAVAAWGRSGFSVHNPVRVPAEDPEGRKKLADTIVVGALNLGGSIEMIPNGAFIDANTGTVPMGLAANDVACAVSRINYAEEAGDD